ncbi:MAG TPA: hypothetical protein VFJ15_06705, partial [Oleiagrimonas sp.]|nr:hypothetical protein [Oleiagrimonas sp.]
MARFLGLIILFWLLVFSSCSAEITRGPYAGPFQASTACDAEQGGFPYYASHAVRPPDYHCDGPFYDTDDGEGYYKGFVMLYPEWGGDYVYAARYVWPGPSSCSSNVNFPIVLYGVSGLGPMYSSTPSGCRCVFVKRFGYGDGLVQGDCYTDGHPFGDSDSSPSGNPVVPLEDAPDPCGGGSCYDAETNQFCAVD